MSSDSALALVLEQTVNCTGTFAITTPPVRLFSSHTKGVLKIPMSFLLIASGAPCVRSAMLITRTPR